MAAVRSVPLSRRVVAAGVLAAGLGLSGCTDPTKAPPKPLPRTDLRLGDSAILRSQVGSPVRVRVTRVLDPLRFRGPSPGDDDRLVGVALRLTNLGRRRFVARDVNAVLLFPEGEIEASLNAAPGCRRAGIDTGEEQIVLAPRQSRAACLVADIPQGSGPAQVRVSLVPSHSRGRGAGWSTGS